MTSEQFCYWLQGIAEAGNTTVQPTPQQWTIIKDHLQEVFKKVTPTYTVPSISTAPHYLTSDLLKRFNEKLDTSLITC